MLSGTEKGREEVGDRYSNIATHLNDATDRYLAPLREHRQVVSVCHCHTRSS